MMAAAAAAEEARLAATAAAEAAAPPAVAAAPPPQAPSSGGVLPPPDVAGTLLETAASIGRFLGLPLKEPGMPQTSDEKERWFATQVAAAAADNFEDFARLECVALRGRDREGRRLLTLLGAKLPPLNAAPAEADRFARYVLSQLSSTEERLAIIYYHTDVSIYGRARFQWLWNQVDALPARVQQRLEAVYVVHPMATFSGVLALLPFALCAPFAGAGLAHVQTHYVDSLKELWRFIEPAEAPPPRLVADADAALASERAAPVPRALVKAERASATEN